VSAGNGHAGATAVRRCRWHECRLPLTARQARFCSRACTVRQQNRDRARARERGYHMGILAVTLVEELR
jgi:hypothetical protein